MEIDHTKAMMAGLASGEPPAITKLRVLTILRATAELRTDEWATQLIAERKAHATAADAESKAYASPAVQNGSNETQRKALAMKFRPGALVGMKQEELDALPSVSDLKRDAETASAVVAIAARKLDVVLAHIRAMAG